MSPHYSLIVHTHTHTWSDYVMSEYKMKEVTPEELNKVARARIEANQVNVNHRGGCNFLEHYFALCGVLRHLFPKAMDKHAA